MILGKEEQTNLKARVRKEIIKIRVETNGIGIRKTLDKTNKIKSLFSEKIKEIDKPLRY